MKRAGINCGQGKAGVKGKEMELTDFRVTAIRTPQSEHIFVSPVAVIDEGSFYRIAGTYIFDKCRIKGFEREGDKLIIRMKDDDVVLTVIEKK